MCNSENKNNIEIIYIAPPGSEKLNAEQFETAIKDGTIISMPVIPDYGSNDDKI